MLAVFGLSFFCEQNWMSGQIYENLCCFEIDYTYSFQYSKLLIDFFLKPSWLCLSSDTITIEKQDVINLTSESSKIYASLVHIGPEHYHFLEEEAFVKFFKVFDLWKALHYWKKYFSSLKKIPFSKGLKNKEKK